MSQTYSLVCHEIKGKVLIGEGGAEMSFFYGFIPSDLSPMVDCSEFPKAMEGLKDFLNASRGHPIFLLNNETEGGENLEYREYSTMGDGDDGN